MLFFLFTVGGSIMDASLACGFIAVLDAHHFFVLGISSVFIYKLVIALCYFVGCHPNLVDVWNRAITQIAQDANKFVFSIIYAKIIIIGENHIVLYLFDSRLVNLRSDNLPCVGL